MIKSVPINPINLASDLIKFKSVTPKSAGSIDHLISILKPIGFKCSKLVFGKNKDRVENLYARLGTKNPNLCFAGHVDVVPEGNKEEWSFDPFSGEVQDNMLLGRGSVDMKSSIASFISAISSFIQEKPNFKDRGSISLLITSDEEGKALNGTKKVVEWLKTKTEIVDACIVGEPTNPNKIGDMIKIGRRGSYSGDLIIFGTQGHVGYPHLADNPIDYIERMVYPLVKEKLDEGNKFFEPSSSVITSIDVKNESFNIIPSKVSIKFNIRFNNIHTPESISKKLIKHFNSVKVRYEFKSFCNALPFVTDPDHLVFSMKNAIKKITNTYPKQSTTGGTSDARFIKDLCPVIEFGLVGKLMHKVDEKVSINDLLTLTEIYKNFLQNFFKKNV